MNLTWKRNIYSNRIQFFEEGKLVGDLKYNLFWQSAKINYKNNKYEIHSFKFGFINSGELYTIEPKEMICRFETNSFKRTGKLKQKDKIYQLHTTNFLGTKKKLSDNTKASIEISNFIYKGSINSDFDNPALLFTAYYMSKQKNIFHYLLGLLYIAYMYYFVIL